MHCTNCGAGMPEGTKFCGKCGQSSDAVGARQSANSAASAAAPSKSRGAKTVLWVSAAIIVLVAITQCDGSSDTGTEAASTSEPAAATVVEAPALQVTAIQLFDAYQANEAAAQQQYGGKRLEVTGTVDGVDLDMSDEPVVLLRTSNQFMSARARLIEADHSKATGLAKGSKTTLLCAEVTEIMGTPSLKDCSLAN